MSLTHFVFVGFSLFRLNRSSSLQRYWLFIRGTILITTFLKLWRWYAQGAVTLPKGYLRLLHKTWTSSLITKRTHSATDRLIRVDRNYNWKEIRQTNNTDTLLYTGCPKSTETPQYTSIKLTKITLIYSYQIYYSIFNCFRWAWKWFSQFWNEGEGEHI